MGDVVIPAVIGVRKLEQGSLSRGWDDWWNVLQSPPLHVVAVILTAVGTYVFEDRLPQWITILVVAGAVYLVALLASVLRAPYVQRNEFRKYIQGSKSRSTRP